MQKAVSRDQSDAWTRIAHRCAFYGEIDTSADYVIVDDVITLGGTLADLRSFILGKGGRVQEAVAEAAKIDPRLGQLFERFLALGLAAFAALFAFLAYQLQSAQYELQKSDSAASSQFYEQAIHLLERQAAALEEVQSNERVERKSSAPAADKSNRKPLTVKSPSKRRADVRKQRRIELKTRRRMFPRRPHGENS